jgi:chemotaxis protein CheX
MNATEEDLCEIAVSIWESMFTAPLHRVPTEPAIPGRVITGCVTIKGAWDGAVMLTCERSLATGLTAQLFDTGRPDLGDTHSAAAVTEDDVRDTVGEVTNMLAGNYKALLAHPSHISLPTVAVGAHYDVTVMGTQQTMAVRFRCCQGLLQISVHKGNFGAGS